jgi:hypothetical protein
LVAYWRRSGLQPQLGFTFTRIHQANNPGLFLGVSASIN